MISYIPPYLQVRPAPEKGHDVSFFHEGFALWQEPAFWG